MGIEFIECFVGGRKYIRVESGELTLALLEVDGSALRTYGSQILFHEMRQILDKMKELQSGVKK